MASRKNLTYLLAAMALYDSANGLTWQPIRQRLATYVAFKYNPSASVDCLPELRSSHKRFVL
jgi:hypothetical protein